MSRRDTIIVAVLINAGLLTLLFATAMNSDDDQNFVQQEVARPFPERDLVAPAAPVRQAGVDEVDQAIAAFRSNSTATPATTSRRAPRSVPSPQAQAAPTPVVNPPVAQPEVVTVTVPEGGNLERIARANGTTVKAIMEANNLRSFTVQVGQKLVIPLTPPAAPTQATAKEEFYIVKGGDNPWTISRRTGVDFEEILRLNGLDERKARRLQPGDKLRIR